MLKLSKKQLYRNVIENSNDELNEFLYKNVNEIRNWINLNSESQLNSKLIQIIEDKNYVTNLFNFKKEDSNYIDVKNLKKQIKSITHNSFFFEALNLYESLIKIHDGKNAITINRSNKFKWNEKNI